MDDEKEIVAPENDTEETTETVETEEKKTPQEPTYTEAEKKAYARMKVAEKEARDFKLKLKALEDKPNPQADPEELRLIAKGLSDEEIDHAKVISKGKEITLTEALKDPMFVAFQKELQETARKEKAKLGASKGSDTEEDSKTFDTGLGKEGEEKHRQAWNKARGK